MATAETWETDEGELHPPAVAPPNGSLFPADFVTEAGRAGRLDAIVAHANRLTFSGYTTIPIGPCPTLRSCRLCYTLGRLPFAFPKYLQQL